MSEPLDDCSLPKPNFERVDKILANQTRDAPKRRSTRKNRLHINSSLRTSSTLIQAPEYISYEEDSIRNYCKNSGLAEMAVSCGLLPNSNSGDSENQPAKNNFDQSNGDSNSYASLEDSKQANVPRNFSSRTNNTAVPMTRNMTRIMKSRSQEIILNSNTNSSSSPTKSLSMSIPELQTDNLSQPVFPKQPKLVQSSPINKKKKKSSANSDKSRGLRYWSSLVMKKVQEKGNTTYSEVADELVQELKDSQTAVTNKHSNIRRRVYDALNVLRAIKIINKQKKTISWVGPPGDSIHAVHKLEEERNQIRERIQQKRDRVRELHKQYLSYEKVIQRNQNAPNLVPDDHRINIPFILVSTRIDTQIECDMAENKTQYSFLFERPFLLYSETQLLEMMNMCPTDEEIQDSMENTSQTKDEPEEFDHQNPQHINPASIINPDIV